MNTITVLLLVLIFLSVASVYKAVQQPTKAETIKYYEKKLADAKALKMGDGASIITVLLVIILQLAVIISAFFTIFGVIG